jgi:hypothetical protein
VFFNDCSYIAKEDNINQQPPIFPTIENSYWGMISRKGSDGVNLVPKGNYNNSYPYVVNDLVSYSGGTYYCIQNSIGNLPTDTVYWAVFMTGGGDMFKDQYDPNNDGMVETSKDVQVALTNSILPSPITYSNLKDRLDTEYNVFMNHINDSPYYVDINVGDGTTDATTSIQTTLNDAIGKVVIIPSAEYKITNTLDIPNNTIVFAYGAKIFNTTENINLLNLGNGVKIYGLELQGAGNSIANASGVGISIKGTDANNYKNNISLVDCYIHDIGFYGIYSEFSDNISIQNTRINNIGYAGFGGMSVKNIRIDKSSIKGISPGNSGNAYGIFL